MSSHPKYARPANKSVAHRTPSGLILRPVRAEDADAFHTAHAALKATDNFDLGLNYDAEEPFEAFVERHRNFAQGKELPEGLVPATFLVAVVDGEIVGRSSIRHELNHFLATEGGHIGYGVLEPHRGRGIATEILRRSLVVACSLGIETALVICDEVNVASATVIERCGGQLRDTALASDGMAIRRYDIPLA